MADSWTSSRLLTWTTQFFRHAGIPTPRLDAEILLSHALGIERIGLYLDPERPVNDIECQKFREYILQRRKRKPIAYITGWKEFWSMRFKVNPTVLIPRPETETMVEFSLELLKKKNSPAVLDLATGSGCVAIVLAKELPESAVSASDISETALQLAELNARGHNLAGKIRWVRSDWFSGFQENDPECRFDAIITNPPYIPDNEYRSLAPEIRFHEPELALRGGSDGLDPYRVIFEGVRKFLKPGGFLCAEFGYNQGQRLCGWLSKSGFIDLRVHLDYSGAERFLSGFIPLGKEM